MSKRGLRFGDTLGASGNTTHLSVKNDRIPKTGTRSKMTVTPDKPPKSNLVTSSESR